MKLLCMEEGSGSAQCEVDGVTPTSPSHKSQLASIQAGPPYSMIQLISSSTICSVSSSSFPLSPIHTGTNTFPFLKEMVECVVMWTMLDSLFVARWTWGS